MLRQITKSKLLAMGLRASGMGHTAMERADLHFVNHNPIRPPFPAGLETTYFAMGCFWGAERLFWSVNGVYSTAVGYSGGQVQDPTYKQVCSGRTGHAETVQVVFNPQRVTYETLLRTFWDNHNPTTLNSQGNDHGTQYRSALFCSNPEQLAQAEASKGKYQASLGERRIVTEISPASEFYYAEDYHQQYLGKNPDGYCGLHGLPTKFPQEGL